VRKEAGQNTDKHSEATDMILKLTCKGGREKQEYGRPQERQENPGATKAIIHHIGFAKLMLRGSNSLQRPVMA
jgi:hypothetical protein